jgi:bacteriorhodopsin
MGDVQVQHNSDRGTSWIWAVVILLLVAVIAWFIVGGCADRAPEGTSIEVTVPAGAGASGGTTGGSGTKSP